MIGEDDGGAVQPQAVREGRQPWRTPSVEVEPVDGTAITGGTHGDDGISYTS